MDRFTNHYRSTLLVTGLVMGGIWLSGELRAGDVRGESEVRTKKMVSPPARGWGRLRMRFVVDGGRATGEVTVANHEEPPQACGESVTDLRRSEAAVASHVGGQQAAEDETLARYSASRGIRNVVVSIRHVSQAHEMYAHASELPVVLIQRDKQFFPRVVPLMVGQVLKIQNRDPTTHIALIRPLRGPEMNLLLSPGEEAVWWFARAEALPVPVTCTFNPSMRAYVVVVDNPYVAVSNDDGVVDLAGVPAGEELDLHLWHERLGLLAVPLGLKRGHLRVVVPADGVLDVGEIHIPVTALAGPADSDLAQPVEH